MKKLFILFICIILVFGFSGCKEENNLSINSEIPLCAVENFETLEILHKYSTNPTIVTNLKDFEFLGKYTYSCEITQGEFAKFVEADECPILRLKKDSFVMTYYLLSDGAIISQVMYGDSDIAEKSYAMYEADEEHRLTEDRFQKLLKKYDKSLKFDDSEYSEILINTDLLISISIHNVYDEELVKIPVKEDWAFLGEYIQTGSLPKEENHKLLAYPDTHIIHLNMISDEGDEVVYEKVYLFNDGSIAKQEMCGDSGVTDKTYDVYKAEEKYMLTKEKLNVLLEKYKKIL
jgi:hypothetical protein